MKYHQPSYIAISPDGSRIAFDANTSTVRMWDVVNDVEILPRLVGNRGSVFSIAFSVDGSRIVAAGRDYHVHVWDSVSGAEILRLKGHSDSVNSVAFSTDGSQIVSGADDKTVRLWSVASQAEALPALHGHKARVTTVAFSFNGERVVSGSRDKLIYVWDAQSGEKITVLPGHGGPVSSVSFFPDGLRIVSGADDRTIRVWDVTSAREVITPLREIASEVQLALSPDGSQLVSASPRHDAIRIWDLTMNTLQSPLLPHYQGPVQSMALSPDGSCVAFSLPFVDVKQPNNPIHIWEVTSGAEVLILQSDVKRVDYSSITFSCNGEWLMSYERARSAKSSKPSSNTIRIWNTKTGAEKLALKLLPNFPEIRSLVFSPDGERIASNSFEGTVCVWDAESGAQIFKPIKLPEDESHQLPFRDQSSITFSHDGTKIAAASHDFCAYIRDATSGEELTPVQEEYEALIQHDATIWSVAFSSDDEQIISQSRDGTTRVWNATTGEQISLQEHNHSFGCHVYAPIVLDSNGWIVDTKTQQLLSHLPDDIYDASVLSIASSETLLALGTEMGLFIMHFPPNMRSGTVLLPGS
jgi:WD40 repeat protein